MTLAIWPVSRRQNVSITSRLLPRAAARIDPVFLPSLDPTRRLVADFAIRLAHKGSAWLEQVTDRPGSLAHPRLPRLDGDWPPPDEAEGLPPPTLIRRGVVLVAHAVIAAAACSDSVVVKDITQKVS